MTMETKLMRLADLIERELGGLVNYGANEFKEMKIHRFKQNNGVETIQIQCTDGDQITIQVLRARFPKI